MVLKIVYLKERLTRERKKLLINNVIKKLPTQFPDNHPQLFLQQSAHPGIFLFFEKNLRG